MQTLRIGIFSILVAAAGTAQAHEFTHEDMDQIDAQIKDVAPLPGIAKATPHAPGWCARVAPESDYSAGGVQSGINDTDELRTAKILCSLPANEKGTQHAVQTVVQRWMNESGVSVADADWTIAIHLDQATYKANKSKLCKTFEPPPEADPEDGAPEDEDGLFRKTRKQLFGCGGEPSWMNNDMEWHDLSAAFLDQSATPPDEMVRLGYLLNRAKRAFEDPSRGNEKKYLTPYGMDSVDYRGLNDANVLATIDVAPYKGNTFAKATIIESLGRAHMAIAILDARAANYAAKDPDYKEVLFDAPKRAIDEYTASAKQYAAEIARSNQFEHDTKSPKLVAACEAALRADFLKVYGASKHATKEEAQASLSNPVTSLLLQRLVRCMTITKQGVATDIQNMRINEVRYARGPRSAAYFAIIEAIEKIHVDRPKFPLSRDLLKGEEAVIGGGVGGVRLAGVQKGIVKSAVKKGNVVLVTFVTTKVQVMNSTCTSTGHLLAVRDDGSLQYEQSCHNTGLAYEDTTPTPMNVPVAYATGIAPNTYTEISDTGLPVVVYKDKTKAKLLTYYGFNF